METTGVTFSARPGRICDHNSDAAVEALRNLETLPGAGLS